jgi:hypothetical protein
MPTVLVVFYRTLKTTLYCSKSCVDKAYKAKKKEKIQEQIDDNNNSSIPKIDSIGNKPYMIITQFLKFLRKSIYPIQQFCHLLHGIKCQE